MQSSHEFDVVCLGGGVAAESLAGGLRGSGLTLAIVERELVGGECPYWGCIPSKTLLRSGETLSEADRARRLAASRVDWTVDFQKVATRARWMARELDDSRPAAALQAAGARLFRGEGVLTRSPDGDGRRRAPHRAPRGGDRQRRHCRDSTNPWAGHRRVLDESPGDAAERAAVVAGDSRRRRDRHRARAGLCAARLEGDGDRGWTDASLDSRSPKRAGAAAAPGSGRHHRL